MKIVLAGALLGALAVPIVPVQAAGAASAPAFALPEDHRALVRSTTYAELASFLQSVDGKGPVSVSVEGKSREGRDLFVVRVARGAAPRWRVLFYAQQHGDEVSGKDALLFLVRDAVRSPESFPEDVELRILPMVNPDGAEYDIARDRYEKWRKNRRNNGNGTYGVDLNRNYGYEWGTGGSSDDPSSDVYMGPKPFSEPETQVIRDFVEAHLNAKVLLTFHTFSELVLYPWGHSNDPIPNQKDRDVFVKMAKTMAAWNGYTPEQASDLYIASGDTTDWAYGTHGIFAFTFELSPTSMFNGGFYPGAGVIDKVFDANLKPVLYMIDLADDPYRALSAEMDPAMFYEIHPLPKLKI